MRIEIEPLERRELFTVPAGFTEQTIVAGIPHVAGMTVAPDGTIYLSQQRTGQVRVVKNGVLQASAFATLPVSTTFETGLTGIAVDSNFASNRYLYAYWTAKEPTVHNVVTRFTVNTAGTSPV